MGTPKRKFVSGTLDLSSKGTFAGVQGYQPRKNYEIVYAKSYNLVHFGRKMVPNAAHNASLSTLT